MILDSFKRAQRNDTLLHREIVSLSHGRQLRQKEPEKARERERKVVGEGDEAVKQKQTILVGFVFIILAAVSAQDYSQLFAGFGPYLRQSAGMRDPRSNRGPVLFPPGPAPNSADTSGVIVGASGYGFVPPSAAFLRLYYY